MTKPDELADRTIRFDILITEEDTMRCSFKYNLTGVPEEQIAFFHRFMEGFMILMNEPGDIAQVAMDAHAAAATLASITDSMAKSNEAPEEDITGDNVVSFKGRLN